MEEDDFSFDFERQLDEQQRRAAEESAAENNGNAIPADVAIPVNQSAGSFKRNYRQVTYWAWLSDA